MSMRSGVREFHSDQINREGEGYIASKHSQSHYVQYVLVHFCTGLEYYINSHKNNTVCHPLLMTCNGLNADPGDS